MHFASTKTLVQSSNEGFLIVDAPIIPNCSLLFHPLLETGKGIEEQLNIQTLSFLFIKTLKLSIAENYATNASVSAKSWRFISRRVINYGWTCIGFQLCYYSLFFKVNVHKFGNQKCLHLFYSMLRRLNDIISKKIIKKIIK